MLLLLWLYFLQFLSRFSDVIIIGQDPFPFWVPTDVGRYKRAEGYDVQIPIFGFLQSFENNFRPDAFALQCLWHFRMRKKNHPLGIDNIFNIGGVALNRPFKLLFIGIVSHRGAVYDCSNDANSEADEKLTSKSFSNPSSRL